jgi:DNA-binding NarL/FixJ family response regulator
MSKRIRVCIAEDHETVRTGLRLAVEAQPDMEVVCDASDGTQAVQSADALHPDVLLLDLSMPGLNGLEVTRAVQASSPAVAIVVLTRHSEEGYVQQLLAAGATGYVLKQSAITELLQAIRAAAKGERYLDRRLAARAADAYMLRHGRGDGALHPSVSEREENVLRSMALGYSNKEIAAELGISIRTVEVHKGNAMRKLGLRGRIDVVRYALMNGWLKEP